MASAWQRRPTAVDSRHLRTVFTLLSASSTLWPSIRPSPGRTSTSSNYFIICKQNIMTFLLTRTCLLAILLIAGTGCNSQTKPKDKNMSSLKAGKDYVEFSRVKIMDKEAFTEPAEAYSVLLPDGWSS